MQLNEYQATALNTKVYVEKEIPGLVYTALGLNGEAGEVAEAVKKLYRDDDGILTDERLDLLVSEAGDVLWYLASFVGELGLDLEAIARYNLEKLEKRYGNRS